jgi:hypothetical protein
MLQDDAYISAHRDAIEECLTSALNACILAQPASPSAFFAAHFAKQQAEAAPALPAVVDAVRSAKALRRLSAEPPPKTTEPTVAGSIWTAKGWLDSLTLTEDVAAALLAPLGEDAGDEALQLAYVRALASQAGSGEGVGRGCVLQLLREGPLLDRCADKIWAAARGLASARAASAAELRDKFCAEGAFTMAFSGLSTFFGGLERLIGPPNPQLHLQMTREHTASADSKDEFFTPNYGERRAAPPPPAPGGWAPHRLRFCASPPSKPHRA